MARGPRVVAELGRPETPDETAARKAESSRIYRSSQTFRNLIAALLATLGVVIVIIFAVPRGNPAPAPAVDVAEIADGFADAYGRPVISPDVPENWRVNQAQLEGNSVPAFTIVYVPDAESYINIAQAFDADAGWVARTLNGAAPTGTETIDGIEWQRYEISDARSAGGVSYALATAAGPDQILVYGTATPDTAAQLATTVTDTVLQLREETP